MSNLWLVLFWTGPIEIGIFLVSLGTMIYQLTRASEISRCVRREYPEQN